MHKISRLEWYILDSLSDNREWPATIITEIMEELSISREEVIAALLKVLAKGFIDLPDRIHITKEELLVEAERNINWWLGLTILGCSVWEAYSEEYSGESVDWSSSWVSYYSLTDKRGHINGASLDVCLNAVNKIMVHDREWEVERASLEIAPIEGFEAKYYKYIRGGYRITFTIKHKGEGERGMSRTALGDVGSK